MRVLIPALIVVCLVAVSPIAFAQRALLTTSFERDAKGWTKEGQASVSDFARRQGAKSLLIKQWADEAGKSEAEILRQSLDHWMASEQQRREARTAREEERAFIESRIAEGPLPGGRTRKREELYEEQLSRHDRDAH